MSAVDYEVPAAAYAVMAEAVGEDYFKRPVEPQPGDYGFFVYGPDYVRTEWIIPASRAGVIADLLTTYRRSGKIRTFNFCVVGDR